MTTDYVAPFQERIRSGAEPPPLIFVKASDPVPWLLVAPTGVVDTLIATLGRGLVAAPNLILCMGACIPWDREEGKEASLIMKSASGPPSPC